MIEDKQRWNTRHVKKPMKNTVAPIVQKYIAHAKIAKALDLACGTGRNTHFLEKLGFKIDAVDLSDYALSKIKDTPNITKIETDLDSYNLKQDRYDLIINTNYLNRRLVSQIKDGLKPGGLLVFETFMLAHGDFRLPTMNLDYLLRKNELLHSFIGLDIIYYEEKIETNEKGERVKKASLVAKKS